MVTKQCKYNFCQPELMREKLVTEQKTRLNIHRVAKNTITTMDIDGIPISRETEVVTWPDSDDIFHMHYEGTDVSPLYIIMCVAKNIRNNETVCFTNLGNVSDSLKPPRKKD